MTAYVIRCVRGDGLYRDDNAIVDNLLTDLSVCLQRGRNDLDTRAHGGQIVTMVTRFRPGLLLGQVVKVQESLFGESWYAKITGITHTVTNAKLTTTLTLLKPTDFFVSPASK